MNYLAIQTISADGVALAAIALAGTCVAGIVWLAKYFAKELSNDLRAHTNAALAQTKSNEKIAGVAEAQSKSNQEMLRFMKNLNGKLENAYIEKVSEVERVKKIKVK